MTEHRCDNRSITCTIPVKGWQVMLYALILVAASSVPCEAALIEWADVIEVNAYYDHQGNRVFTQLIFWDWKPDCSEYRVFAWRMAKGQRVIRDHDRDCFSITWIDQGTLREVRSRSVRYTWTQYDPELLDRANLPPDKRRGLRKR